MENTSMSLMTFIIKTTSIAKTNVQIVKKMTKPNAVITKFYTTVPRKVEGEPQKEYKHH